MTNIDVILITYNQDRFIREAVESILMQEVPCDYNVRIIVADDCSTDNTLSIVESYEDSSPFPMKILSKAKNEGYCRNYISAFKECCGEFVMILEGDDYWCTPHHITQHVDFLREHNECSMSANNHHTFYENSKFFEIYTDRHEINYYSIREQISRVNVLGNLSACCFRTMYLVSAIPQLEKVSRFADWFLGMCMGEFGLIGILSEPTSVYRVNSQGLWSKMSSEQQVLSLIKSCREYDELFEGRFHDWFIEAEALIDPHYEPSDCKGRGQKLHKYIPPVIKWITVAFMPPVIVRKIRCK